MLTRNGAKPKAQSRFVRPFDLSPPRDTYAMLIKYVHRHAGIEQVEASNIVKCFVDVVVSRLRTQDEVYMETFFKLSVRSKVVSTYSDDDGVVTLTLKQLYRFTPGKYLLHKCMPELNYASVNAISAKVREYGKDDAKAPPRKNSF